MSDAVYQSLNCSVVMTQNTRSSTRTLNLSMIWSCSRSLMQMPRNSRRNMVTNATSRQGKVANGLYMKGAHVYIPKAISYDHLIASQLPNRWDATQYVIPAGWINPLLLSSRGPVKILVGAW